jgi:SAM-dependent methyltransferase
MISYYKCQNCGFIFTNALDKWSDSDFKKYIYNEDYSLIDRPIPGSDDEKVANGLLSIEHDSRYIESLNLQVQIHSQKNLSIFDYGSGNPNSPYKLAFERNGYEYTDYDPFRNEIKIDQSKRFDFIICSEVIEHAVDLDKVAADFNLLLHPQGLIHLSTLLFPKDHSSIEHWYISPRNGHLSIHTHFSLYCLLGRHGLNVCETVWGFVLFKSLPRFKNLYFPNLFLTIAI